MMVHDLETRLRQAVGAALPQHPIVEHTDLVDGEIDRMSNSELLANISAELTDIIDEVIYDLKCWVNERDG